MHNDIPAHMQWVVDKGSAIDWPAPDDSRYPLYLEAEVYTLRRIAKELESELYSIKFKKDK